MLYNMTANTATLSMETVGVEPTSRSSNTPASTRVVCLLAIREFLCRQTGVRIANLEISYR